MSAAREGQGRSGVAQIAVTAEHPEHIRYSADRAWWTDAEGRRVRRWHVRRKKHTLHMEHHNAYVNTGLNNALDREFGLGGTAIGYIGVDNNSTAVTASTVHLHGAAGATAANQIIKAISPAASRSNQTVTGGATFANADFTSGVFVINKLGLLTTSTDAGTGLVDVIGGTGGSAPYDATFVLDLTGAGTFSATLQIAVTASAT
jgi:hypothetical protein